MRLISITLRHYRIHEHLSVEFDPARTLVGGRNETGKSTLAEAAHRVLFLRAKTSGIVQREMVSRTHHGDPEVTLQFEAAGTRWEVSKRFAGAKGSTLLSGGGAAALRDEAAEAKIDELLHATTAGGRSAAGALPDLWSHLWVWQGRSSEDPSGHTAQHKTELIQHLQQLGATTLLQSANDERVAQRIAQAYDELFTATGRPKAGSKPETARARLEEAEVALAKAKEAASRLAQAADDHARAEHTIAELTALLPQLRDQRTAAETRLQQSETLRIALERQHLDVQAAKTRLQEHLGYDAAIRAHQTELAQRLAAIAPAETTLASLAQAETIARAASQSAESHHRAAADSVQQARLRHDLAAAAVAAVEKSASHQSFAARAADTATLHDQLTATRSQLASLPAIDAKELARLRKLESSEVQATAALAAMATGIEVVHADTRIDLDGSALAPGETRILTDAADLTIGAGTRLRIQPGGGQSLARARNQADAARRALASALDHLALRSADHAASVHEQRLALGSQAASLEARWSALGGATLNTDLAAAQIASEAARQEFYRRAALVSPTPDFPTDLERARIQATAARDALADAESTEATARRLADESRANHETAGAALTAHHDGINVARMAVRDIETAIRTREETHGDAAARAAAITSATHSLHLAEQELAATKTALDSLNPALAAADLDRLSRALLTQEHKLKEAETTRLLARDRLTLDGTTDPEADLRRAEASHTDAVHHHEAERRRAQAIESLHQLFTSSRAAIDRALVQPLANRISGYLQCLFGPGATARVQLTDAGIEKLELARPGDPGFSFATLSIGAREQTAAAVRLAVAEILATQHDGCLPVVFDDAFAHSDPDRIHALQRMLDLAATRGLQIIVLTCTPSAYAGFGAREIQLDTPLCRENSH